MRTAVMLGLQKSREVIYIAGPFTGPDDFTIAHNCNAASAMARRVRAFGLVPFVPHTGLAGGHAEGCCGEGGETVIVSLPDLDWEGAMVECRELLQRCDAVLMVQGWENSKGATEERELAKACGIPVFDTFKELVASGLSKVEVICDTE